MSPWGPTRGPQGDIPAGVCGYACRIDGENTSELKDESMDLAQILIPAVAGLVSGAVGSLVAPWVRWGIEARRERMKARRELLVNVRTLLAEPRPVAAFRKFPLYFQVRDLLAPATVSNIAGEFDECGNEIIQLVGGGPHGGIHPYAHEVLHDLSVREKEWGLL